MLLDRANMNDRNKFRLKRVMASASVLQANLFLQCVHGRQRTLCAKTHICVNKNNHTVVSKFMAVAGKVVSTTWGGVEPTMWAYTFDHLIYCGYDLVKSRQHQ
jgi:hypothetical protein